MKILIAEDEVDMKNILSIYLKKEGYDVATVSNGQEALDYMETYPVDLLLLDWMMPVMDGVQVCRTLRSLNQSVKILMLTAKSAHDHEYQGLSCGADEYVKKPFDIKVLLLRIKKLCGQEQCLYCGNLMLNQESWNVTQGEERLILTKKEFELLRYFMVNRNRILTREQLLDRVWGMDYEGDMRTVDTHVRRLRAKIGVDYIKTSVGMGYIMEEPHE